MYDSIESSCLVAVVTGWRSLTAILFTINEPFQVVALAGDTWKTAQVKSFLVMTRKRLFYINKNLKEVNSKEGLIYAKERGGHLS